MALVFFSSPAIAVEFCSTCEQCTSKLSIQDSDVQLSSDLTSLGDCITISGSGASLDCMSHRLQGRQGSTGITVRGTDAVSVSNCIIENFSNAVRVEDSEGMLMQSVQLLHGDTTGDLLYIRGQLKAEYDHTFTGVTIDGRPLTYAFDMPSATVGSNNDGMVMAAFSDSVSVRNLNLSYGDGVRIHFCQNPVVEGITISAGKSNGIEAYHSPGGTYRTNNIVGSARKGIYLVSSPSSTLSGNIISGSVENGFRVSGASCAELAMTIGTGNTIDGKSLNYYYGTQSSVSGLDSGHISIVCSSGFSLLSSKANVGDGILVYKSNSTKLDRIEASRGIEVSESSMANVSYSIVSGPGIKLVGSRNSTVIGNSISSSREFGIHVYSSDNNSILYNIITSAPKEGLAIHEASGNRFIGNNITASGKGIALECSQSNYFIDCNSSYNQYGLWASVFNGLHIEGCTFQENQNEGVEIGGQQTENVAYRLWHNNIFGNKAQTNPQISSLFTLHLDYENQGNYWGRSQIPAFVPGQESDRLDVIDGFPYWKPFGWLSLPVITNLSLGPAEPSKLAPPTCTFIVSDQDNASVKVNITWMNGSAVGYQEQRDVQNGTIMGYSLPQQLFTKNQNWSCGVQPFDGEDWGYKINSTPVTILNSKPTTPNVTSPSNNSVLGSQTVLFSFSSIDADSDQLRYYFVIDNQETLVQNGTFNLTLQTGKHNWTTKASDGQANSTRTETLEFTVSLGSGDDDGTGSGGGGGGDSTTGVTILVPEMIIMKQNEVKTQSVNVRNSLKDDIDFDMEVGSTCSTCVFNVVPRLLNIPSGQTKSFQVTMQVHISEPAGDSRVWLKVYQNETLLDEAATILRVVQLEVICGIGETKCDGDRIVACNPYGTGWVEQMPCPFGCEDSKCKKEAEVCTPNEVECNGSKVMLCNSHGNAWLMQQECIFGCDGGECIRVTSDPTPIFIVVMVTVSAISSIVVALYIRASNRKHKLQKEKEWRSLENRYAGD